MRVINPEQSIADLVRRDSRIAGLGMMLDPRRLLDGLRGQLDYSRIDDIRLVYLRYKPGMNCLARYELEAEGLTLCAYAKVHGCDATGKLQKAMERPAFDSAIGPGRMLLEDEGIIFSMFPNDAKLPSLMRLNTPQSREHMFRQVFGQQPGWQNCELDKILNYKPERRYVARLRGDEGQPALAKFYTRGGYERARAISRRLASSGGDNRQGIRVIGKSKRHSVIAYRWQPGESLRELGARGNLAIADIEATARALAEFHGATPSGRLAVDPAVLTERIKALGEQAGFLLPHLNGRAMGMATSLLQWLRQQPSVKRPIHGDFYDKQVIVSNGDAWLIDLDGARLDNPLVDLGNYVAHLERDVVTQGMARDELERQQQALVTTYEQSAETLSENQLSKYIALGLFQLLHRPFRDWEQDWPVKTELLLERVEDLFGG
jgi:streptomycin 6-kinase